MVDFSRVIGIDVSEEMIRRAKVYQEMLQVDNVEFIANNGIDLSTLKDASVDFVFSYIILQHCPSPHQVLYYVTEFSRVLKKEGVCLFQTRVSPTYTGYAKFSLLKILARMRNVFYPRYYSKDSFLGNWVLYSDMHRVLSNHFSMFSLVNVPIEIYGERYWNLQDVGNRWRRTFVLCIK